MYQGAYPFIAIPAGRFYRLPDYWWEHKRMANQIRGDVVIAVKGFTTTVPVALHARRKRGIPVAVYLDEWDGALWHAMTAVEKVRCLFHHAHHPAEPCYQSLAERSIRAADTVISTTTWLQNRFGGHIIHAGVDVEFFKPQRPDEVDDLKASLGLRGCKVVVFGGVVRPHKGVEDILEAIVGLGRDDIRLLVVGPITEHLSVLQQSTRYAPLIVVAGDSVNSGTSVNAEIHKRMSLYLDVGDLAVLPLRDTLLAQSQMPIKLFEAMAMGKPVIGTSVSDLPQMLEGCGRIVPPNDTDALGCAMAEILDHPNLASQLGQKARQKCVMQYSSTVSRTALISVVSGLLHGFNLHAVEE